MRQKRAAERERLREERAKERERLLAERREARERERARIAEELKRQAEEAEARRQAEEDERVRRELELRAEALERERQRMLELKKQAEETREEREKLRQTLEAGGHLLKFPHPAPSWETARDYAYGWRPLARILHVSLDTLKRWKSENPPEAIARRDAFIEQARKSRIWTKKQIQTFNYLCKLAGELEFYPQYGTKQGFKESERTVRYFWTRHLGRAPDMALLSEILAWFDGLEPKRNFKRWHASALVLEWGEDLNLPTGERHRGYQTVFAGWRHPETGQGVPPEHRIESYFLNRTKTDMRAGSKEFVREEIISTFESLDSSTNLMVVDWISVANYRFKTEEDLAREAAIERARRLRVQARSRFEPSRELPTTKRRRR